MTDEYEYSADDVKGYVNIAVPFFIASVIFVSMASLVRGKAQVAVISVSIACLVVGTIAFAYGFLFIE